MLFFVYHFSFTKNIDKTYSFIKFPLLWMTQVVSLNKYLEQVNHMNYFLKDYSSFHSLNITILDGHFKYV